MLAQAGGGCIAPAELIGIMRGMACGASSTKLKVHGRFGAEGGDTHKVYNY